MIHVIEDARAYGRPSENKRVPPRSIVNCVVQLRAFELVSAFRVSHTAHEDALRHVEMFEIHLRMRCTTFFFFWLWFTLGALVQSSETIEKKKKH
jgi:hypothetical protein